MAEKAKGRSHPSFYEPGIPIKPEDIELPSEEIFLRDFSYGKDGILGSGFVTGAAFLASLGGFQGAPLYISEISPPNLRGTLLVLESISIVSGVRALVPAPAGSPDGLRHLHGSLQPLLPILAALTRPSRPIRRSPSKPVQAEGLPQADERVQAEYRSIITEVEFQKVAQQAKYPGASGVKLEALLWLDLLDRRKWRWTVVRAKAVALATCVNWLSNFTVGVATPPMLESIEFGTYVFFAVFCGLAGVWAVMLMPETMGRTLEQMDEVFGDMSGREEMEMMRQAVYSTNRILASQRA
ncbi:hypothetical protein AK830_g894 [Neonectria ditissima]|uniref:Major facilitator superfamily (MFS) profile domain-containing protein n=1 Tax=Neonectria ditissima TaxID=78410 RepID=A0A0P7BNU4_9HYPO|nr:hypothetical protein AK830_g894 [Neonectria ditissima]